MVRVSPTWSCVFLTACAGNVQTSALTPEQLTPGSSHEGVVFFLPHLVKLTYAFTARVDDKGNVVGTAADKGCTSVIQKEEVTMLPDLAHPMLIKNASGLFSAAKFNVTLDKGLLAAVNAEPTQKPSDLLTATAALVKEVGVLGAAPTEDFPVCNASPVLVQAKRTTIQ
jgi:hypothetical protein